MRTPVTAIFDLGKTNKKFFLFDENLNEVYKEYISFAETSDDDGFPCDDLPAIEKWIQNIVKKILVDKRFEVTALNFSSYGASFVHLDENGRALTPLFNYLKPFPPELLQSFYTRYGDELQFAKETASPPLAMLNSGLQLYWLKYTHPKIYASVKCSLHLPQYISYLFTGVAVSEYSSIGCHTGLWDFAKHDYHAWIYAEGIDQKLPRIVQADTTFRQPVYGKQITIGSGIHDSSAALLPYILSDADPFLLISTGTWSISLNPFSTQHLTAEDLQHDCLNYMRVDGKTVRAARLLLGKEYSLQIEKLAAWFQKDEGYHKSIIMNEELLRTMVTDEANYFHFENLPNHPQHPTANYKPFQTYEQAYHQLMIELVRVQVESSRRAIGDTPVKKIYIDGGFADNVLFIKLLSYYFPNLPVYTTQSPLGSALGAAMLVTHHADHSNVLHEHYAMQVHGAFI